MGGQILVPYVHSDGKAWDHFYLDSRTDIIYFSRRFNGKKIKFSTHLKADKALQAKRFANNEFAIRIGEKKSVQRSLIMDELDSFMKVIEAEDLSQSTMYNYRQAKKDIKAFWGERYPEEITRDAMPEYYEWFKRERGIVMENNLKILKVFCKYLHQKVVDGRPLLPAIPTIRDPDRKQREVSRAQKKERVLTHDEFKSIYESASSNEEKLIAHIMYTMATRIDETQKLSFSRHILLDEDVPVYHWRVGSTKIASLEGMHALHPSLIEPLKKLRTLRQSEGTDLLFPQKKDNKKPIKHQQIDWKAWRERAGLAYWTAHTFRHTCLTNLFNDKNNNQLMICKLYRVSMKVAMKTYIKVKMESILELRDAVKVEM
jgi:integrase